MCRLLRTVSFVATVAIPKCHPHRQLDSFTLSRNLLARVHKGQNPIHVLEYRSSAERHDSKVHVYGISSLFYVKLIDFGQQQQLAQFLGEQFKIGLMILKHVTVL
jgi:hypothetical protein